MPQAQSKKDPGGGPPSGRGGAGPNGATMKVGDNNANKTSLGNDDFSSTKNDQQQGNLLQQPPTPSTPSQFQAPLTPSAMQQPPTPGAPLTPGGAGGHGVTAASPATVDVPRTPKTPNATGGPSSHPPVKQEPMDPFKAEPGAKSAPNTPTCSGNSTSHGSVSMMKFEPKFEPTPSSSQMCLSGSMLKTSSQNSVAGSSQDQGITSGSMGQDSIHSQQQNMLGNTGLMSSGNDSLASIEGTVTSLPGGLPIKWEMGTNAQPGMLPNQSNLNDGMVPMGASSSGMSNMEHSMQQSSQNNLPSHPFMQQNSQIFVFSTSLANQAAEAVASGNFQSIIEFHCTQPGTQQFLQKQPLRQPLGMNPGGNQGVSGPQAPLGAQNSVRHSMQTNMGPNSFMGATQTGSRLPNPSSVGGPGTSQMSGQPTTPLSPSASSGGFISPRPGTQASPWGAQNSPMMPGMGGPQSTASGSNPPRQSTPGSTAGFPSSQAGFHPGSGPSPNQPPDITHTKVPNENLTPEQLARRAEQLANLRKIQQMLFPEQQQSMSPGPAGNNPAMGGPGRPIPGNQHPQGMGPMGPNNSVGPMGPNGGMSSNGPMGPNGPIGPTGPMGPNGPMGPQGPMMQGPMGPQGPMMQGPMGQQGTMMGPNQQTNPAQIEWYKMQQEYYHDKFTHGHPMGGPGGPGAPGMGQPGGPPPYPGAHGGMPGPGVPGPRGFMPGPGNVGPGMGPTDVPLPPGGPGIMHRQRGPFPNQNGLPGHPGGYGPCGPHMVQGNVMGPHGGPMGCNHPHGPCQGGNVIMERVGNPEPFIPDVPVSSSGPTVPTTTTGRKGTKRRQSNNTSSDNTSRGSLHAVPSPQQMQYLQNFEGQELTITRQPNPSAGPFPPDDGPTMSSSGPSSTTSSSAKSTTSAMGSHPSVPVGSVGPGGPSGPCGTGSSTTNNSSRQSGNDASAPGGRATPSYQQPKTPGTPTVSSSMPMFSPEMPPGSPSVQTSVAPSTSSSTKSSVTSNLTSASLASMAKGIENLPEGPSAPGPPTGRGRGGPRPGTASADLMQLNSKARGKAAQMKGVPPDWSKMSPQQQQAMAVNIPMSNMMMPPMGPGPHGNVNMGPGGPMMGGGSGHGPNMMGPPNNMPNAQNMQGNMMQHNDMQFGLPPSKRQNFGPNGPPIGSMSEGGPYMGMPPGINNQDPNFSHGGNVQGSVPHSIPGSHQGLPINNTYINATMSIGQVNIQSVQPGPGGFPMGAPSMNASQINTSMSQMGTGPNMMNANISTSMNDPNSHPTMSQAQQGSNTSSTSSSQGGGLLKMCSPIMSPSFGPNSAGNGGLPGNPISGPNSANVNQAQGIQVQSKGANTLQYMPMQGQSMPPESGSGPSEMVNMPPNPGGNGGPGGNYRFELDFMQGFAEPLTNLESKVPQAKLQYFPNSKSGVSTNNSTMTQTGPRATGPSSMMSGNSAMTPHGPNGPQMTRPPGNGNQMNLQINMQMNQGASSSSGPNGPGGSGTGMGNGGPPGGFGDFQMFQQQLYSTNQSGSSNANGPGSSGMGAMSGPPGAAAVPATSGPNMQNIQPGPI